MSVLDRILALLDSESIPYRRLDHAPTRTSEESAAVRGEPLEVGAKAILLKTEEQFRPLIPPDGKQPKHARNQPRPRQKRTPPWPKTCRRRPR